MNNTQLSKLKTRHGVQGFTLVELMVAVIVIALLASVAAPSYRTFVTTTRVKSATNEVWSALAMTRSEALKRNNDVTIAPLGGNWKNGWTVATQVPAASGVTGGPTVLTLVQQGPLSSSVSFTCFSNGAAAPCQQLVYNYSGRASQQESIQVADAEATSAAASPATRCVVIDPSGRPFTKKTVCP